ncbi:hypothetical protein [Taklimakanibacter albus]|uniref:Uncharacterized protein n=1 Tax=Taklimakanibacter albus TaxID=2800327 RepID=A0ACC5RFX7_9HYPH|nr:hypothetical protein [Aestuariivirga sp. YIM B02566]MBK1871554.1 hypothetical protein [Aestuariivirga sp. YIM B02566]
METNDKKDALIGSLQKTNTELSTKLNLAYAFIDMLRRGYDALLHYSINYQSLPEYTNDSPLDDLSKKPLAQVHMEAMNWMQRVKSGIDAAVRRKNFKVH